MSSSNDIINSVNNAANLISEISEASKNIPQMPSVGSTSLNNLGNLGGMDSLDNLGNLNALGDLGSIVNNAVKSVKEEATLTDADTSEELSQDSSEEADSMDNDGEEILETTPNGIQTEDDPVEGVVSDVITVDANDEASSTPEPDIADQKEEEQEAISEKVDTSIPYYKRYYLLYGNDGTCSSDEIPSNDEANSGKETSPMDEVPSDDEKSSNDTSLNAEAPSQAEIPSDDEKHSSNEMLPKGVTFTRYIDLSGTKKFLADLGITGGELHQARSKENNDFSANDNYHSGKTCSYCGKEITGADFYRLENGRCRCSLCSRTLVKGEQQLKKMIANVKKNMELFFDISLSVEIGIQFLEERKLKKRSGVQLGTMDEKNILILGCAVQEKKHYYIYLENSAPYISVIATLAHELTHIWQYVNWKCKKRAKRPVSKYEAMAKWVEIQYLYLVGETKIAEQEKKRTLARDDEDGEKFIKEFNKLLEEYPLIEECAVSNNTMTLNETPFNLNSLENTPPDSEKAKKKVKKP